METLFALNTRAKDFVKGKTIEVGVGNRGIEDATGLVDGLVKPILDENGSSGALVTFVKSVGGLAVVNSSASNDQIRSVSFRPE